jgi:CelD/BcsL family acetyltransferase involved in cellulose biosynthesis
LLTTTPSPSLAPSVAALAARRVTFSSIPRDCWDRLLSLTPSATPFARWSFHRAWWDAYAISAHEQYLVCVPGDAATDAVAFDHVVAIVPLMHRHEVEAKTVFFGASYHADYATILAHPGDLPAVAAAVADALTDPASDVTGDKPWDAIDLRRLRSDDPALPALEAALDARRPGLEVIREVEDVCPVVTAPSGDWDEYLATLDRKARHEIRRKLRRAATAGTVSIDIAAPTPAAVDAFIDLHVARFGHDGLFPDSAGGEMSRQFIHRLAEIELAEPDGGRLHVGLVRCGKRLIFAAVAFDDGRTCYLYNAGMDPDAAGVSPGVTGTAAYIRDRLAAGRTRFDFLRGSEPYKYEWGARDEPIERLLVTRRMESRGGFVSE